MKVKRTYSLKKMSRAARDKYLPEMINDIAAVISKDIPKGIRDRRNLDNSPTKRLKQATIDAKTKKGYAQPDLPRAATGAMTGVAGRGGPFVSQRAKPGKLKAILQTPARAFYSAYQNDTRPWFGIAKRTEPDVDKAVRTKAIQIVKSAHVGGLR